MPTHWYYQMMGTVFGPHTGAELVDLARHHRISPEDLVRKGDAGEWIAAYRVHGLFEAASHPERTLTVDGEHEGPEPAAGDATAANRPAGRLATATGSRSGFSLSKLFGAKDASQSSPRDGVEQGRKTEAADDHARGTPKQGSRVEVNSGDYAKLVDTLAEAPQEVPVHADWFCICHGEKLGPLSFRRLKELSASGELKADGRVWSTASPKWCRARDVPGLMDS